MSAKTDYFIKSDGLTVTPAEVLVNYDARSVPATIRAIEGIKGRSFWVDRATWELAYVRLSQQQARLLMDSTDRLVREIRATRDGVNTPLASQDPLLDPYTLELASLAEIAGNLSTNGSSAAFILEQIRLLQEAANAGDAESQAELLRIGAIIAGAL